jgi:uncharacterized protein
MKRIVISTAILIVLLVFSSVSAAEFPKYNNEYVNDFAGIFSSAENLDLQSLLYEVRQNTTAQIVLATIKSLESYSSSDYATKLFNEWRIGDAEKDNGLLILYALAENKIWVATGYGLEGILPDSKIGRLLDEYYVPLRDSNKTKEGIIAVTQELISVVYENADEVRAGNAGRKSKNDKWDFIAIIILIFFVVPAILRIIFRKKIKQKNEQLKKNKKQGKPKTFWDILFWMWLGSSIGRGFSGSSSGFGGGG